jgi:hypothetical protein
MFSAVEIVSSATLCPNRRSLVGACALHFPRRIHRLLSYVHTRSPDRQSVHARLELLAEEEAVFVTKEVRSLVPAAVLRLGADPLVERLRGDVHWVVAKDCQEPVR